MKKYVSCFLFFLVLTAGCLVSLFVLTIDPPRQQAAEVQMTESVEQPALAEGSGEEEMAHLVLNQEAVEPEPVKDSFCLVAEEGYLIVYDDSLATVNLFTHMPLSDFPPVEQERLMEGIWFPTMSEIFSYLESYTS